MFRRTQSSQTAIPLFHVPERTLWMLNLARRFDDMLMFYVVAAVVVASIAVLPAYAAIGPADHGAEAGAKSDRLPNGRLQNVCAGQSWGQESGECLVAILKDSGRAPLRVRIVTAPAERSANVSSSARPGR